MAIKTRKFILNRTADFIDVNSIKDLYITIFHGVPKQFFPSTQNIGRLTYTKNNQSDYSF